MYNFFEYILFERWYCYIAFFIFIFIADRFLRIYSNNILGWLAEKKVAHILLKLDPKKYKVINNIMIGEKGNTSQIDHILISDYGIFVIETKNYYGRITGRDYGNWILAIYKFKRKIDNPVTQNFIHIKTLKKILEQYSDIPYYSIIVFTKRSVLKVRTSTDVIYHSDLLATIKKYEKDDVSEKTSDKIYEQLLSLNIKEGKAIKEHIGRIKTNKEEFKNKIEDDVCPKCGGILVIRNSRYGKFKGCSNFPKCRFTANFLK